MFRFEKQTKYTRIEIHEIVKGPNAKSNFDFDRTGYGRIDEDLFAFINIGFRGKLVTTSQTTMTKNQNS